MLLILLHTCGDHFLHHTDDEASLLIGITVDDHTKQLGQLQETVARLEASGM